MKKLLLLFIFALFVSATAQAQQYNVEEVSFADIDQIYICHENENFEFREKPIDEVLGRNYRNIPHPLDRFFITVSNDPNREPIKFSNPSDPNGQAHPYYVFNHINGDSSKLYVVIHNRNGLIDACNGRDERPNTTYIIKDIPPQGRLFITYKNIQESGIEGSPLGQNNEDNEQAAPHQGFDVGNPHHVEPANNNGLPKIPELPRNFDPEGHNSVIENQIPANPPANDEENKPGLVSQNPDTDKQSLENTPNKSGDSLNDPQVMKSIGTRAEGCSFQVGSTSIVNFSWTLWAFVLTGLIFFKKQI